tara:strand:- start:1689 stop:1985 length:297 start_codon:yes stop_codon:yes gene_type:complete
MSKASLVLHDKVLLKGNVIVETKIWEISDKKRYPDGLKYSLFAIFQGEVLVGYDNHHPKGHHRHIDGQEFKYKFSTLEKLKNDFKADLEVQMARKGIG